VEEIDILTRATLLGLLLIACSVGLGMKTYWLWKEGPWDLPSPAKTKASSVSQASPSPVKPAPPILGTEAIVAKNLFDPERGASKTKEAEADTRAMQRIRSMVLLGTAILGPNRFAIVQESDGASSGVPATQGRSQTPRRLKAGDMVEGFTVSEINEKGIVFAKGTARVEVPVDFFRKVDIARPAVPIGPGQPVVPNQPNAANPNQGTPPVVPSISRRPRLPTPPNP
jgi:hypothetical protein